MQTIILMLFGYMNLWFMIGLIKKRNDVADIAWGLGFVLLAWLSFVLYSEHSLRALMVNILITLWGCRLSFHISKRHQGKEEDYRYLAWRNTWKHFNLRAYFQIFMLQGLLLFAISLPIIFINQSQPTSLTPLDLAGLLIWSFGFLFETIADKQLAAFTKNKDNKGKLIQSGLWQYSRHPNYFGEVTQWWGIFFISLNAPHPWISLISPLTITFLILKVSGIPMLEEKMKLKPGFQAYAKKTNVFFPWFTKKS